MKGSMEEKSFSCCKCDKAFLREVVKRGPKEFSLCLNSKSMREKSEGGKGQNTVVRKDSPS